MSECIHNWDWDDKYSGLICRKCGALLDGCEIPNHMTRLQSELAEAKAKFDHVIGSAFEFESVNIDTGDLGFSILDMARELERTRKELTERDALIEQLIEAGDETFDMTASYVPTIPYVKDPLEWHKLVDKWGAMKAKESER